MERADARPSSIALAQLNNNRLGAVMEAVLQFIAARGSQHDALSMVLFNDAAHVVFERQARAAAEQLVLQVAAARQPQLGTSFSAGLKTATNVLKRGRRDPYTASKTPVVIFLSDGADGCGRPMCAVQSMRRCCPHVSLHTTIFGSDPRYSLLREMATGGGGRFMVSLDECQLVENFRQLAASLHEQTVALV